MADAKHTPGPWLVLESGRTEEEHNRCRPLTICDEQGSNDLANVYSSDDATVDVTRKEAIANAHLMAAAPELLTALDKLAHYAECQVKAFSSGRPTLDMTLFPGLCREARAAIAKATGGAS